jgi:hypothetical protein
MRTIKNLAVPQNDDVKFPFSTILNETDTNDGTPVVEEIYGDVLTNLYKLLQVVGITPTGTQDSDTSQYQILEALKKLPNTLNDIEQILTLTGTVWSIPLPIELLPNKYFFVARASEAYSNGGIYTFEGSGATSYPFTSSGFKASDEVLIIIDQSGVRAYSLSFLESISDEIFTVMGLPIAFNDSNKMYYQSGGNLISDTPSINYLENIIRVDVSDGTVIVNDILISNGYVICFCLIPSTNVYFFRQFALTDLSVSAAVTLVGTTFGSTSNFSPYVYMKQGFVYITNSMNTSANDYSVSKLTYNAGTAQLTLASSLDLDVTFVKTSNAVVKNELLYTLVTGVLSSYSLTTGTKVLLGDYGSINGNLFGFNGKTYFSSGEVAKSWVL